MTACPCCGQPIAFDRVPVEALSSAPLSGSERRIVDELVNIYPRATTIKRLVDAVYFDHPDGGPEDPENTTRQFLVRVRRKLRAYGWTVPQCKTGEGAFSSYRLSKIDQRSLAA